MTQNTTYYIHSGNNVSVAVINPDTAKTELPAKVYSVQFNEVSGQFFLSVVADKYKTPSTVYGDALAQANRVTDRYLKSEGSVGAIFSGDKGSGKTLATALICNKALAAGVPVVQVSSAFHGPSFQEFMDSLGEAVVLFDEFAKVYERDKQERVLSFFDGATKVKRLVIITENDERMLSQYIIQRPGRFLYHFRFGKLSNETVLQYCNNAGLSSGDTGKIISLAKESKIFSFDMLVAIVDEVLTVEDLSFEEIVEVLNITSASQHNSKLLSVSSISNGKGEPILMPERIKDFVARVDSLQSFDISVPHPTQDDSYDYMSSRDVKYQDNVKLVMRSQEEDIYYTFTILPDVVLDWI